MTKTILTAFTLVLATGVAGAQAQSGMADRARTAHAAGGPPGTVGAMEAVVQGLAMSAQDVAAQQEGRSTAAEGGRRLVHEGSASVGGAPGTVGAAPGSDPVR